MCLALTLPCTLPGIAEAGIDIVDDLGRTISLERPAKRIVPLYAAFSEILSAMGLNSLIVGRTKADTFPDAMRTKPVVGTHMRPNIELIMGVHPDLIIQMEGRAKALEIVDTLEKNKLPVAVFQVHDFASLFSVIKRIGVLCDAEQQASHLVESLQERLNSVAKKLAQANETPRVFFEVRYPNLLAAGKHSIVTDIIAKAGGTNCVTNNKKLVRLNEEALLGLNPEIYLLQRGPMNPELSKPQERPHFQTLSAVQSGKVYVVDEKTFSRPGPRNVQAVEQLAALLHPELFSNNEEQKHE